MTEKCPDCGRPPGKRMGQCGSGLSGVFGGHFYELECAQLTIANLRARLAEIEHQGESAEYALSAALGMTAFYADGSVADTGDWETMIARVATLNPLAYASTHHEQGQEDADEVCDVCAHAVTEPHTFLECIRNIEAVHDGVNGHLNQENETLAARVAKLETGKHDYQAALRDARNMLIAKHPANAAALTTLDCLETVQRREGFEYPAFVGYEARIQELEAELQLVRDSRDHDPMWKRIDELAARILAAFDKAEPAREGAWIACSERMPETDAPAWFTVESQVDEVRSGSFDGDDYWNEADGYWLKEQVKYWMPRYVQPAPAPPPTQPSAEASNPE